LNRIILLWVICVWAIGSTALYADIPPPAYVEAALRGQGFLMTRLGRCFLVTAAHVVGDKDKASVMGAGTPGMPGEAQLLAKAPSMDVDVAVLEVTSGPLRYRCGSDYVKGISEEGINNRSRAVVSYLRDDGSLNREAYDALVNDVGPRTLTLALPRGDTRLTQGYSGGIVSIGDLPAGMLQQVEQDHANALRYDVLMEIVFGLLKTSPSSSYPSSSSSSASSRKMNVASAAAGAILVSWSTLPLQPEFATSNLLQPPGPGIWEVSLARGPVTFAVQLAGRSVQSITHIELQKGDAPSQQLVRAYEVLTSVDGMAWPYAGVGEFLSGAQTSVVELSTPRLARYIKIIVRDSFDETGKIAALSRVVVW
jgi:hypothetical protein